MNRQLNAISLRIRGRVLMIFGRVLRDELVVFRGQQAVLRGRLIARQVDDSYLGPSARPPVRRNALIAPARLRLVAFN